MKQFNKILALLLAVFLLAALTVLPAFADDDGEMSVTATSEEGETETGEDTADGEDIAAPDETPAEDGEEATSESADEKADDATAESDDATAVDATVTGADDAAKSKGLSTTAIVWIVVGGVVVVAAVVLCVVFREKVGKFFRVYKSEIKKIVWLPWNQTCKSTLVVLVILIICAAAICLVDLGLSKGFLAFLNLFNS